MKEAFPHPKDDLISGIVSLPQEKRARLASRLTRQLVDGHTLVAQGLKRLGITHVYCVSGNTAFGFNAMDLETAVRHGVAVIVVVVNNEGNCGALMQKTFFPADGERVTMFQPGIRYENIMRVFGGHAEFVDRPEQLRPVLERSTEQNIPACINVRVDPYTAYPRDL